MSSDRVAEAPRVGHESVFRWKRQVREGGVKALRIKKAPGRPRRLTPGQEQSVKAVVRDVIPRQLLGVALWTRALVAMVIAAWFGIGVSVAAAGRLLRGLGLSPQRPAYRAWRRDPAAVTRWTVALLPQICRLARARRALVLFADEMSLRIDHRAGTTWGEPPPAGRTPRLSRPCVGWEGRDPCLGISCGNDDVETAFGQFRGNGSAKAAVGSSDDGDALRFRHGHPARVDSSWSRSLRRVSLGRRSRTASSLPMLRWERACSISGTA